MTNEYKCPHCDWTGNSRQARAWHYKNHHPELAMASQMAKVPAAPPFFSAPVVKPVEKPRAIVVPVGEDYPDSLADEGDEDEATFDGETPEIPYIYIFLAVVMIMVIAGAVVFREKVVNFLKKQTNLYEKVGV